MEHGSKSPEHAGDGKAEATRLDEERFRFIADAMPQLSWAARPDGEVDYYNQRWIDYTGLTLEQGQGSGWKDVVHPDDLSACRERWMHSMATQCGFEFEIRLKRASDDAYRWHLARAFPQRNQQGEVINWVGTATDIEEQRRTRDDLELRVEERTAELARANQQMKSVLDGATNVSIIGTNTEGLITVFNSGAENLLGYRAAEMVGKQTPAIIHLESEVVARGQELTEQTGRLVRGFDVFVHSARLGLPEEREWTYVHMTGRRFTVNLVVTALRDGNGSICGFLGVAMDVTARRQAEADAIASAEHFRLIVETIRDYALLMLDTKGHVVSWNAGAEGITGYHAEEIIGRLFTCFYTAEDRQGQHPAHELQAAETNGRYSEEGWRVRKDGSRFWAEVVISSVRDDEGKLLGFAKVVHDITKRKQTEERFQLVVEASPSAMIMVAASGRIALVNNRTEKLFGFSRQELVGQPLEILIPPRFRASHRTRLGAFFADASSRPMGVGQELLGLCSDGTEVPVEISLSPLQTSEGEFVLASIVDISERKRVEKTLRDQASMLDLASDAIIILDEANRITYWNLGAQRLYGWSKEKALGQDISEMLKTRFPESKPEMQDGLLSNGFWKGELEHTRRDGSVVTVASTWTLRPGGPDQAARVLEIDYDLTVRKQAESQVLAMTRRLELATGALQAGIWEWQVDSGKFDFDDRMRQIYGFPQETGSCSYQDWAARVVPEDLGEPVDALQRIIATKSQDSADFRIQQADGSLRHVQAAGKAVMDETGRVVRVIGINLDVSERKQAELALHQHALMLNMANDAIFIRDGEDRITYWNQGAERVYGWSEAEALGQVVHVLFQTQFAVSLAEIKAHLMAHEHWKGELIHTRKDGQVIHVASTWTIRRQAFHQALFILCINHDITEQKRAACELLEARLALEERLLELAATNQELARKSEEVEAFVYIVSHDLRAPLVNLQGFCKELELSCDELREKLSGTGDRNRPYAVAEAARAQAIVAEEIPESLRYIATSTNKFNRLINALLELSRYGRQIYRIEKLGLESVVLSTLDLLRLSLATANVRVSVSPLPVVYADATAIGQVFANLIGNAVKYRQPARPCHIEIGGEANPNEIHCWVRDNGVGLPKGAGDRLFHVFQRFHPNLAEGEGIGLATVRRILERHGGKIWAEGEEGVGTTFHFTLPAAKKDEKTCA